MNIRGQDAGPVAVFVFVLALFIVLYVLFIPESAREELLDINGGGSSSGGTRPDTKLIVELLDEVPGQLTPEGRTTFDYAFPSVTLFHETDAGVIKRENSFILRNSWTTKQEKEVSFSVKDPSNTDNVILSFQAPVRRGILQISLNGKVIYEQRVRGENSDPVYIESANLNEGLNSLKFSVSSVGIRFWSSNQYEISNMQIVGDVTDLSKQDASNTFHIPIARSNIDQVRLRFVPECDRRDAGIFTININSMQAYRAVPDCASLNTLLVPPSFLSTGVNNIQFITEGGTYIVDRVRLTTELREKTHPTYFFTIDDELFDNITSEDYIVNMTLTFLRPEDRPIDVRVTINQDNYGVFQPDKQVYSRDISSSIEEGSNAIRLVANEVTDIISLTVRVEEKKD